MLKVLIVEDNLLIADDLEEALVQNDYKVCGIARTVEAGVKLAKLHKPKILIIDQKLDGNGLGTDVIARLGTFHRVGILYVTGNVANVMTTAINGHGCLAKPYQLDDLLRSLAIVEGMVATGRVAPPFPRNFRVLPQQSYPANTLRLKA